MRSISVQSLRIILALALLQGGAWSFAFTALAATVTDVYDRSSSLAIDTAANHKIVFTTATGVSEGEAIAFTFPSAFETGTIIEDDVDIAIDGVDYTTAADCGGSEEASVAMASDVLTITICVGDGGAIGVLESIAIEIGTNASASGSGTHRITNPSTVGTYMVVLSTTADSGSIPLPIIPGTGANTVSGSVPSTTPSSSPSGAGAPSSPSPDPVAPNPEPTPVPEPEPVPLPEPEPLPDPSPEPTPTPSPDIDSGSSDTTPGAPDSPGAPSTDTGDPVSVGSGGDATDDAVSADGDTKPSPSITETELVGPGDVVLRPIGDTFIALPGSMSVRVEIDGIAESVTALVEGRRYPLSVIDGAYAGNVLMPRQDTLIVIEIADATGAISRESYFVDVRDSGFIYEVVNDTRVAIPGAVVTVYRMIDGIRIPYGGIANPFVVDTMGTFALYVPNGKYIVTAGKSAFSDGSSGEIIVTDNILRPAIALERLVNDTIPAPAVPVVPPAEVAAVPTSLDVLGEAIAAARAIPEVQVAANISLVASGVLAGSMITVLASGFQLWPFLQYLITSPILFFARRKRKAFGTVYNAATKLPVDLAIVRLFTTEKKLLRTVVTDPKGKYFLAVAPGNYLLEVVKPNYAFPSTLLAGKKEDGAYLDVYSGQEIVVRENEAVIAASIPLDPALAVDVSAHRAIIRRFLRVLQHTFALCGIGFAVFVLIVTPTMLAFAMCGLQIAVYLFMRRLALPKRPKSWGIVYDGTTRQPVGNAVVRLFEPTYNKLIETVVTDRLGRYAFLVGPNEYYATYAKPGYIEHIVQPLDFRAIVEPSTITIDVPLAELAAQES